MPGKRCPVANRSRRAMASLVGQWCASAAASTAAQRGARSSTGGEEQLRGRQQHRLVQLLARTLAERVEQADRLDQVAEEIEPQRPGQLLVEHRRIDVDNAAAQG